MQNQACKQKVAIDLFIGLKIICCQFSVINKRVQRSFQCLKNIFVDIATNGICIDSNFCI